jgi:hypothetical protein
MRIGIATIFEFILEKDRFVNSVRPYRAKPAFLAKYLHMRLLLTALCLLLLETTYCQNTPRPLGQPAAQPFALTFTSSPPLTYRQLRDSSAKFRDRKVYDTAFALLAEGIKIASRPYHDDIYGAAALASLCGWTDTAFYYLKWLLREGEFGMITGDASTDCDLFNLRQSADRWWKLVGEAEEMRVQNDLRARSAVFRCIRRQDSLTEWQNSATVALLRKPRSGAQLAAALRGYNSFPRINLPQKRALLSFAVPINDSTESYYAVQLPDGYDPSRSYPLLLVLHGAVFMNLSFPNPDGIEKDGSGDTAEMNRFFSAFGFATGTIVVYPHANKEFNWMYPDDGFPMVPRIVRDLKKIFNIDDDRVFISGHSNGATGVVSYLLKEPGLFAGFYGFNSNPRVSTGGTFIRNALNRSYFNVSTDKDYYFPLSGHDTLARMAVSLGIDWQNHTYKGFPHWFPDFDESRPAFALMFSDMAVRTRNPYRHDLYWECDDTRHGRCDWLNIDRLDTLAPKAEWQTTINFTATHWINNRDTSKMSDTAVTAFRFPRRSGAIKASYADNRFDIGASRVGRITLFISPDMVDLTKPVTVWVNGRERYSQTLGYNRDFMIRSFQQDFDRKAIWVNYISLDL